MDWSDPETLASFVNAVSPSLIGGVIALTGALVVFGLQQSASRRADRARRLELAAERLMETLDAARIAYTAKGPKTPAILGDMLTKSWRFAWLLTKRERPVADWAWAKLFGAIEASKAQGQLAVETALVDNFADVMARLNEWRVGSKRIKWFRVDLERLEGEKADRAAISVKPKRG